VVALEPGKILQPIRSCCGDFELLFRPSPNVIYQKKSYMRRAKKGKIYSQAILEAGGSRPAMASFKAFRGREPSIDALLRHQGMA
jgi:hypothetical protein